MKRMKNTSSCRYEIISRFALDCFLPYRVRGTERACTEVAPENGYLWCFDSYFGGTPWLMTSWISRPTASFSNDPETPRLSQWTSEVKTGDVLKPKIHQFLTYRKRSKVYRMLIYYFKYILTKFWVDWIILSIVSYVPKSLFWSSRPPCDLAQSMKS